MKNLRSQIPFILIFIFFSSGCHTLLDTDRNLLIQQADHLEKKGRYHWERRINPDHAKKAQIFLSIAYELKPEADNLAILYSQACYFNGLYIEQIPEKKDSLFLEGYHIAKGIVYHSKSFQKGFNAVEDNNLIRELRGIEALGKSSIPALYWWVANLGRYLINKPVVERLNYRDLLETIIHKILTLDPTYHYGGGYRMLGTVYIRLPGIELSKSKQYFDQAILTFPNYLGTKVLLAQYYYTKAEDREHFHRELQEVLSADPAQIPEIMAENLFEQGVAQQLLEQESSLFE